jgi:hypothetical protein
VIGRFGGHLGTSVSALVDGQLDEEAAERAWEHVLGCAHCRAQVEREAWIKRRLSTMGGNEPSARLLGSLQGLPADGAPSLESLEAWAEVDRLEESTRGRRRAAVALVGAGSVSAAVLGFAALGSFGLGGPPPVGSPAAQISGSTPTPTPTSAVLPVVVRVQGRLPGWRVPQAGPRTRVPGPPGVDAATPVRVGE